MRDTIRKFDPDALYLGDRYQSFYYPEVVAASRPYVDVVSTNLNASWNDGTFIRSYLDTLHALTGKPVLVSEFYMAAKENRSGNKNAVGGFPIVSTQQQRAQALSNTLRSLARLPYVVGADWFQYYDEPPHGRKLDGEDYNFGLVDIHDQPYEEVTDAFDALDLTTIKSAAGPRIGRHARRAPCPSGPIPGVSIHARTGGLGSRARFCPARHAASNGRPLRMLEPGSVVFGHVRHRYRGARLLSGS